MTTDGVGQSGRPQVGCALTRGGGLTEHDAMVLKAFANYLRNQPSAQPASTEENPTAATENPPAEPIGDGAAAGGEPSSPECRRAPDPVEHAVDEQSAAAPAGLADRRDGPGGAASTNPL